MNSNHYPLPSQQPATRALVVMPLAEQRGGGELMLLHLLEHGRGLGIDWSVAFFNDGPMATMAKEWGVPTFIIRAGRLRQPFRMAGTIVRLRRLIRRERIDVVLSWMGKAQLYGGSAAALAGVPAVWYQLGLPDPAGWQDRLATRVPAKLVLTCSKTAAAAQAKLRPKRPIRPVYPGVDLSRFNPVRLPSSVVCRRKLGLPANGPLIGIVGRLQRWKGMHHLVDAMPAVLEHYPDAHAVIVGGDHAFEKDYPVFLRGRIANLGLTAKIILTGLRSDVPEWMQAMDIIVHASDAEPFGIVVIEAMALGKPVIATESAGPREIITHGIDGRLWPPGRPDALTTAILAYLDNPTTAANTAGRALRRAADFSVARYVRLVVDLVRQAASTRPNAATVQEGRHREATFRA